MSTKPAFAASRLERRDAFRPKRTGGLSRGAVLAIAAHAALIGALALGLRWRTSTPDVVSAEIWSAVPQTAAPAPVEAPPPPPPPPPEPAARAAPPPPPPPDPREAEIALEKQRQVAAREAAAEVARKAAEQDRLERERRELLARREKEQERREKERKEAEDRKRRETAEAERREKEDAQRVARQRDDQLKRMQQMAGATGAATATGTAQRDAAPSTEYAGRIRARIKPNIVFAEDVPGNPSAKVVVGVAPSGQITSRRLLKSSGNKAWDDAVLRAIDRTEVLPRDLDGRVPPAIEIEFRPNE